MPVPPDPAAASFEPGAERAILAGRYRKQARFAPLGAAGQARLAAGRVLIVGCGATGSALAETLVRAGVGLKEFGGWVRPVDRDFVELSNLARQTLYTEADAAARTPKAIAAAERLARINSEVALDPRVEDVTAGNIERLAEGATLLLDGSDNFEARYLLNDLSLETGVPWVYCGAVGGGGRAMPVLPGRTACLRCVLPDPPPPGETETCDTAGVILPAVNIAASFAAGFALKILGGLNEGGAGFLADPHLLMIDAWAGTVRKVGTRALFESGECPACGGGRAGGVPGADGGERLWLRGGRGAGSATLCGRGGVQLAAPPGGASIDLESLATRWRLAAGEGAVRANRFLAAVQTPPLEADGPPGEVTIFADGRVIVTGTTDPARARQAASEWAGG
ncbi:ThiF family adenylyltransferase [Alienimonas californiensis]|uniref:Sulfur carrier protein ThiS adenylyltransferase n=1 Tax=Alienimonas californiensis TaxID=2527989 RepID=A0A517P6X1_9PLAN|nr:ThiF family adenylyltransferase [Alienimonas californiensis]QDT15102.1 Sulfur carrier protein ThiS adenylyltransferase [Alienimonas californiensis]